MAATETAVGDRLEVADGTDHAAARDLPTAEATRAPHVARANTTPLRQNFRMALRGASVELGRHVHLRPLDHCTRLHYGLHDNGHTELYFPLVMGGIGTPTKVRVIVRCNDVISD